MDEIFKRQRVYITGYEPKEVVQTMNKRDLVDAAIEKIEPGRVYFMKLQEKEETFEATFSQDEVKPLIYVRLITSLRVSDVFIDYNDSKKKKT